VARHRWARPVTLTEEVWRDHTADELAALGQPAWASAFRACGRFVEVFSCGACGADDAAARRPLTCSVRCCPSCQRLEARRKVKLLTDAVSRVPDVVAARREAVAADLREDIAEHQRLEEHWAAQSAACANRRAWLTHNAWGSGSPDARSLWVHLDRPRPEPPPPLSPDWVSPALHALRRRRRDAELRLECARADGAAPSIVARAEASLRSWDERLAAHLAFDAEARLRGEEEARCQRAHDREASLWDRSRVAAAQVERETRLRDEHRRLKGRARRHLAQVEASARGRWGWRLVTVSPRWTPTSEADLTPHGLGQRVEMVQDAFRRLWDDALSAGGLAAATLSVELSDRGHVHGHALVYGPWLEPSHLSRVARCMVDVRKVRPKFKDDFSVDYSSARPVVEDDFAVGATVRDAVVEAVKYAVKLPAESHQWLSGKARRVVHPALAARWTLACRSRQLVTHYGIMRDAIRAAEAMEEPDADAPPARDLVPCRHCKEPLDLAALEPRRVRLASWLMRGAAAWRATRSYRLVRRL
jgi:hypothetical protein